ncbi:MAG: hypothetical protein AAF430_02590 [Myxococcota bacterium]
MEAVLVCWLYVCSALVRGPREVRSSTKAPGRRMTRALGATAALGALSFLSHHTGFERGLPLWAASLSLAAILDLWIAAFRRTWQPWLLSSALACVGLAGCRAWLT